MHSLATYQRLRVCNELKWFVGSCQAYCDAGIADWLVIACYGHTHLK